MRLISAKLLNVAKDKQRLTILIMEKTRYKFKDRFYQDVKNKDSFWTAEKIL